MKPLTIALVGIQILSLAFGQVLWKKGVDQAGGFLLPGQFLFTSLLHLLVNPTFLVGTSLYLFATLLWLYLLARFELSFIYPFFSLTFVVSFVGAWLFLGETISPQRWTAIGFVSLGIFLLLRA